MENPLSINIDGIVFTLIEKTFIIYELISKNNTLLTICHLLIRHIDYNFKDICIQSSHQCKK